MISIVIPYLNEYFNIILYSTNLYPVIDLIMKEFDEQYEYIFINDGSIDNSTSHLKWDLSHLNSDNLIKTTIIEHVKTLGVGASIQDAINIAEGDEFIVLDADLSYRPACVRELLRAYRSTGADCISSSPYLNGDFKNTSFIRLYGSKLVNRAYAHVLGARVTCVTSMFRLYKTPILRGMHLESDGFDISAELLCNLLLDHRKVVEIGIKLRGRKYDNSKMKLGKEIINTIKLFIKVVARKHFPNIYHY
jgi:glycosyltransferase involved in cell wall biosynthesis